MDYLITQMRRRISGSGQENKEGESSSSNREKKLPPQKTQSFKGEKKKGPNWFKRQLSRQMSRDYDSVEYPTAVAAAAFAIRSLEELSSQDQKAMSEIPDKKLAKTEDLTPSLSDRRTLSRKPSDRKVSFSEITDIGSPSSIKKTPSFREQHPNREKPVVPASSMKKTSSFADRLFDRTGSSKPEGQLPKSELPSTKQSAFPPLLEVNRQGSTRPKIGDSEADAWERAEMAKINERYEKLHSTINTWEEKKNKKAKRKVEKTEAELDKRRAKALEHHHNEMRRINKIASGARTQAEKNRRNEELKVKEKANRIRSTGKLPPKCFCF